MPIFYEKKARELTKVLLSKDAAIFRQYIPDIERLNAEAFQNLFKGNMEYFEKKKPEIVEDYFFKQLIMKFSNYNMIINIWYLEESNYKYIQELWYNYIAINDLNGKTKEDIEDLMEKKTNITFKS